MLESFDMIDVELAGGLFIDHQRQGHREQEFTIMCREELSNIVGAYVGVNPPVFVPGADIKACSCNR